MGSFSEGILNVLKWKMWFRLLITFSTVFSILMTEVGNKYYDKHIYILRLEIEDFVLLLTDAYPVWTETKKKKI